MTASYSLKIITPKGIAYSGTAVHAEVPVENGYVGILPNHASYLVASNGGKITARESNGTERGFKVGAGFFEINQNQAVFLTQSCQSL